MITCEGCGACCMMGCPPMYGYLLFVDGGLQKHLNRLDELRRESEALPDADLRDSSIECWQDMKDDITRIESLPLEAMEAIVRFWAAMELNAADIDGPCCWLDPLTRQCRWYDHRPALCRDFEVGGEGCLCRRSQQGKPKRTCLHSITVSDPSSEEMLVRQPRSRTLS